MPTQKYGQRICRCRHDKSMHSFNTKEFGQRCMALDGKCDCSKFLSISENVRLKRAKKTKLKYRSEFRDLGTAVAYANSVLTDLGFSCKIHSS